MRAAGFSNEEIEDIADYLKEKDTIEFTQVLVNGFTKLEEPYREPNGWRCAQCDFRTKSEESKEIHAASLSHTLTRTHMKKEGKGKEMTMDDAEKNKASLEFMELLSPVLEKASELGIIDLESGVLPSDEFMHSLRFFGPGIEYHISSVMALNDFLVRTNQHVSKEEKKGLVLLVWVLAQNIYSQEIEAQGKK